MQSRNLDERRREDPGYFPYSLVIWMRKGEIIEIPRIVKL